MGERYNLWQKLGFKKKPKAALPVQAALANHLKSGSAPDNSALTDMLAAIEQELSARQKAIPTLSNGSTDEAAWLRKIRALEDQRFELLSQLHGNRIENYNQITP
jgi:hypothetical protein